MTGSEKTAVVLGGTVAHIALLKELKGRGYRTILVDYYDNPVAKPFADIHLPESTMDFQKVAEISSDNDASLVISACVDQANITACYAMEELGLNPPYPYSTAKVITDKADMKKRMVEFGIPTAKHVEADGQHVPDVSELSYPLIVKPVDCCAASGVKKVEEPEALESDLAFAIECSRNGRALIEEYVTGIEVSAYCIVADGEATVLATAERLSSIDSRTNVLRCYGTIMPSSISDAAVASIQESAKLIAKAYGLDNTPLHVQAIVDGDKVNIIEFAPRVGGGVSYFTIRQRTGFDIISAAVDSYEGNQIKQKPSREGKLQLINLIYANPGEFDSISGIEELKQAGVIDEGFGYKTSGMAIGDKTASSSRAGVVVISGNSVDELKEKLDRAIAKIKVLDKNGNDLFRSELCAKLDLDEYAKRAELSKR